MQDLHKLLRPETVESLFLLHQVTRDLQYQDWGWHMFGAFQQFSEVNSGGYSVLDSVLLVSCVMTCSLAAQCFAGGRGCASSCRAVMCRAVLCCVVLCLLLLASTSMAFLIALSGHSTVQRDHMQVPQSHRDRLESFGTGEALNYLYLPMDTSPASKLPLDQWLYNTEAHLLLVKGSPAEEAVKHTCISTAEMPHCISGCPELQHLAE